MSRDPATYPLTAEYYGEDVQGDRSEGRSHSTETIIQRPFIKLVEPAVLCRISAFSLISSSNDDMKYLVSGLESYLKSPLLFTLDRK